MKKARLGARILSLVCVLVMVMTLIPLDVLAVTKFDIVVSENKGVVGFDPTTQNQDDTINWPIKVYDYLADGMLFEFAQNGGSQLYKATYNSDVVYGGQYVLGNPTPTAVYNTDLTTYQGYQTAAWTTYTARGARYNKNKVAAVDYVSPRYLRLSLTSTANYGNTTNYNWNMPITYFQAGLGSPVAMSNVRYMVLVYRSSGVVTTANDENTSGPVDILLRYGTGESYTRKTISWTNSANWTYRVIDLQSLFGSLNVADTYLTFHTKNTSWWCDLAQIGYFSSNAAAAEYGEQCLEFISEPGEYTGDGLYWNGGNNTAYGMLYATNGSGWNEGGGNAINSSSSSTLVGYNGGGYYTHQIGYRIPEYASTANTYNQYRKTGKDANGRYNGTGDLMGENGIYFITNAYYTSSAYQAEHPGATSFDMSELDFGGYKLFTEATINGFTAGLLQSKLGTDRTPQYKQETVEYIADLLSKTLVIPKYGTYNGYNNYNYVAGVKDRVNKQFGSTSGVANDLAQGLRNCLGIYFSNNRTVGTTPTMGTYADTLKRANGEYTDNNGKPSTLKGEFLTLANAGNITTCMDAAYYLLHNLFVANSYNQLQDDYRYLTLSGVTMDNGKDAYIFDGGFSTGADPSLIGTSLTQDQYKAQTQNAVIYNGYDKSGDGTISLGPVQAKDLYYYAAAEYARTTRFPFLPVTDAEDAYAGDTDSYYFAEDGKNSYNTEFGTYKNRNYNYVLASNGEFVYNEADGLFFEFEGDDDVYLFINGELVLDIGAGHAISNCQFEVNDYVKWARDVLNNPEGHTQQELDRAEALYLVDGEIASFDFYYMERHGYGANMRIVTNMHITDPSLRVEKEAYQGGKQIDFGGIVDPESPIEYSFKMSNNGNTKLYNLTFDDADIGVSLTPENGLYVTGDDDGNADNDINGYIVTDSKLGKLEASDLVAYVHGYKNVGAGNGDYNKNELEKEFIFVGEGAGEYTLSEVTVSFADNEALKSFLKTLEADGTDDSTIDDELTHSGSGLWVDSTVTFKGIYYKMTTEQSEAGVFNNTVKVTASTKSSSAKPGYETLKSEDSHRVYVTAIPSYYQWAGHDLFIPAQTIFNEAAAESDNEGSLLHDYEKFFDTINGEGVEVVFSDRSGYIQGEDYYEFVDEHYDVNGVGGFKTNYPDSGIKEFYLLMYKESASGNVDLMVEGEYAIVRVLIIVADTKDSTYVLDYGLGTDNLDQNGELFKNDELFGGMSGNVAKLLGISDTEPSYLNVKDKTSNYNRIDFDALSAEEAADIKVEDGKFNVNVSIPEGGAKINYDSHSGLYTLIGSGTTTIHAQVPLSWEKMYLYYWYDNGVNNGWPGQEMTMTSHGSFRADVPGNVPHIILVYEYKDGTETKRLQTVNLNVNPGQEAWVTINSSTDLTADGKLKGVVEYQNSDGILHMTVPEGWGDVYIYCWDIFENKLAEWPGIQITDYNAATNEYVCSIPGDITNLVINNGKDNGKQTIDLEIEAGKETWIEVADEPSSTNGEGTVSYYTARAKTTLETVAMHATVPSDWESCFIHYWTSNGSFTTTWPGIEMTWDAENNMYTIEDMPADIVNVVINNGGNGKQTEDISITPGLETWFDVSDVINDTSVMVDVPGDFGTPYFYFFDDNNNKYVGEWPGTLATNIYDNTYYMQVPLGATKFIVNNNAGTQSQDIRLVQNSVNQYKLEGHMSAVPVGNSTKLVIEAPDSWSNVIVHHWNLLTGSGTVWPGETVTKAEDGKYYLTLPEGHNAFIVNNKADGANGTQTGDITVCYLGGTNLVKVYEDGGYEINSDKPLNILHEATVSYGKDAEAEGFTFTPTDFMDKEYSIWLALAVHETDMPNGKPTALGQPINIGKEVQMYKKVTVLPATVVYYEDDFSGIVFNDKMESAMAHYGVGSGSLSQSVDQNQQYGKDSVYMGSENDEQTGGSLADFHVAADEELMRFNFTGTGFEFIGHTHSVDSGMITAYVFDPAELAQIEAEIESLKAQGKEYDEYELLWDNSLRDIPVITEFDNGADGGKENISFNPLIRVSGLEYGSYTIIIKGVPIVDWDAWKELGYDGEPVIKDSYICFDGLRIYQPINSSATISETENLALGKTYTGATIAESAYLPAGDYYDADFTDGNASNVIDFSNRSDWFGFHKTLNTMPTDNGATTYGQIIIDLEDEYSLAKFRTMVASTSSASGIGHPYGIDFYVSNDKAKWTFAGSPSNFNINATAPYWAELELDENVTGRYVCVNYYLDASYSWCFANEIEVYGAKVISGAGIHDAYIDTENGATFSEVRDLIKNRQAFAVKYSDTDGLSVSGGTSTWIENRNEALPSDLGTRWTNNEVNSVNDYLLAGPNNEVYMVECTDTNKTALAFYVTEEDSYAHTIQIGARAVDYNAYIGAVASGQLYAELQYGAMVDGQFVWKNLTSIVSSAEQYYTIPYTECPYDAENDRYQVVLRVADSDVTGMVSYTTLKTLGLTLNTLNTNDVPDVIYYDEMMNTLVDSKGNTLDTAGISDFIGLTNQMSTNAVMLAGATDITTVGASSSALGALADSFTADNSNDFVLTENSRFFIVSNSEPTDDVKKTVQLVQSLFAADALPTATPMEIVWGEERFAKAGDILVYVSSDYSYGDEEYKLVVSDRAKIYCNDTDALLYGLNMLQKHFRNADSNAIKGFTMQDKPDTKERTVHLDMARKYLTKDWIINYIREMSWMGYNAIELHLAEDGGFRSNIWDGTAAGFTSPTGNNFSWAIGSMLQPWCYDCPDPDIGKYLTGAELVEICEAAKLYHMEVIPSFDTPAHVGWITKKYETEYNKGNTSVSSFRYGGTTYTLPARINYRSTGTYDYAVLNLGNANVQKLAFAMYTDLAAFFHKYAGSTHFNIGADEVGLASTDTWDYADFIDYVNDLNDVIKAQGYESVRMYNDFADRPKYQSYTDRTLPTLDSDIEIVFWDGPNTNGASWDTTKDIKKADAWVAEGRNIYSGVQFWTYYTSRIANTPGNESNANFGKDSRDPTNTWWTFYRNQEDYAYAEWDPTRFSEYTDTTYSYYYSGNQLKGGYFMVWMDYAGVNTEVEHWNGVWDSTNTSSKGKYFYSLRYRMWSNAIKQWNWDIDSSLTFANFKTLRDSMGAFPGCVTYTGSYAPAVNLPKSTEVKELTYTVTFLNADGTVLSTQTVKPGEDATAPATPSLPTDVWSTYTFTGWDKTFTNVMSDLTVTAQYKEADTVPGTVGYLEIKVEGGSNFNMTVEGGGDRPMGTYYLNAGMDFGQSVTVVAETTNGNKFIGWVNAITGDILTTNTTYSFKTSGNDVFVALYDTDSAGTNTVIFKNTKSNQVIGIQRYAAGDSINFPTDPNFPGYEFAGWSMTETEIQAEVAAGNDVTVTALWDVSDSYVSVVVNNGKVTKNSGMYGGKYVAYKGLTVTADSARSGQKFSHWEDAAGNIKSYSETYKLYPYKDVELTAVYVAADAEIDYKIAVNVDMDTTSYGDRNIIYFDWSVADASAYTFVNAGVLLVDKNDYRESSFVVGNIDPDVIHFVPARQYLTTTGSYSITRTGFETGSELVAKAFVQYKDEQGILRTVYSDMISVVK